MNTTIRTAILLTLGGAASHSMSATLTVGPSLIDYDYITITAAIAAGVDGDVIEIQPGLYPENLSITNKDLTLRNAGGGAVTVFGQNLDKCLKISGASTDAVIEGLTLTNGSSNTFGAGLSVEGSARAIVSGCIIENNVCSASGAGMYVSGGATVTDTVFRNNTTNVDGGGLYIISTAEKAFLNCTFEGNAAANGGAMAYGSAGDIAEFVGCRFVSNSATLRGGAIAVLGTASTGIVDVQECVFDSNTSNSVGGAVWVSDLDVFHATNSLFISNVAADRGGVCRNEQIFEAVNCTFANNSVLAEGINDTFETNRADADINLLNCIVVNDSAGSHTGTGELKATYCLLPEAAAGPADAFGNFNADPMFTDPIMGDYTLSMGSAAIDAGNSRGTLGAASIGIIDVLNIMSDLNGDVRNLDDQEIPNTGVSTWELCVDLGAYEYQPGAAPVCTADLNGDGVLDFFDISAYVNAYSMGCP